MLYMSNQCNNDKLVFRRHLLAGVDLDTPRCRCRTRRQATFAAGVVKIDGVTVSASRQLSALSKSNIT